MSGKVAETIVKRIISKVTQPTKTPKNTGQFGTPKGNRLPSSVSGEFDVTNRPDTIKEWLEGASPPEPQGFSIPSARTDFLKRLGARYSELQHRRGIGEWNQSILGTIRGRDKSLRELQQSMGWTPDIEQKLRERMQEFDNQWRRKPWVIFPFVKEPPLQGDVDDIDKPFIHDPDIPADNPTKRNIPEPPTDPPDIPDGDEPDDDITRQILSCEELHKILGLDPSTCKTTVKRILLRG